MGQRVGAISCLAFHPHWVCRAPGRARGGLGTWGVTAATTRAAVRSQPRPGGQWGPTAPPAGASAPRVQDRARHRPHSRSSAKSCPSGKRPFLPPSAPTPTSPTESLCSTVCWETTRVRTRTHAHARTRAPRGGAAQAPVTARPSQSAKRPWAVVLSVRATCPPPCRVGPWLWRNGDIWFLERPRGSPKGGSPVPRDGAVNTVLLKTTAQGLSLPGLPRRAPRDLLAHPPLLRSRTWPWAATTTTSPCTRWRSASDSAPVPARPRVHRGSASARPHRS